MPLTKTEQSHQVTRIILHIPHPASAVLERVHSSLSTHSRNGLSIVQHVDSREDFEKATNAHLGPHDFMHFATIDHSRWLQLYGVHQDKSLTRLVFGNPFVAVTMLEHDVTAGLFAPVETLVIDRGEGQGTDVVYLRPSDLVVAGSDNLPLREAAEQLDAKLETFWNWVADDESQ